MNFYKISNIIIIHQYDYNMGILVHVDGSSSIKDHGTLNDKASCLIKRNKLDNNKNYPNPH